MALSTLDNFYIGTYGPEGLNILHNFYPLNETSGSAIDQINANNCSFSSVTQGVAGFLPAPDGDTCYTSSGTNYGVTAEFTPYPLSWECWMEPSSINVCAIITQGAPGIYLGLTGGGYIQLNNLAGGANTIWGGGVTPIGGGSPLHLVMTTDGSSTAANTKAYLNGTLLTQSQFVQPQAFTSPIGVLMNYSGASVTAFQGKLAKMAMYSAILTQAQVTANYNAGLDGIGRSGFFFAGL
jgi:hypothetical protein